MLRALDAVATSGLPDAWIGAGVIRDLVWGRQHGKFDPAVVKDIDVAYYDADDLTMERDLAAQETLARLADLPWEATNQAAVHTWYHQYFGGARGRVVRQRARRGCDLAGDGDVRRCPARARRHRDLRAIWARRSARRRMASESGPCDAGDLGGSAGEAARSREMAAGDGGAARVSSPVPGRRMDVAGIGCWNTARMADGTGRIEELTRQGLAAAVALARRHGLPAGDPRVLSSRGNLLVHLAPAPVVARVATLTAFSRSDPFAWLAREVAVARYVAGVGGPVVPPASVVDPGPHWQDAFVISLWEHIPALDVKPSPAEVGVALAHLHTTARGCPAELGDMSPVRELISDGLGALERAAAIDAGTLAALRSAHSAVLTELAKRRPAELTGEPGQPDEPDEPDEQIVLHGDAHAGNMLADPSRGWLWIDLEETCRGPAAWDLATAAGRHADDQGLSVLRAYAAVVGSPGPAAAQIAPFYRARVLEGAVWSLCMAQLYPARYADVAARLLAEVLAS